MKILLNDILNRSNDIDNFKKLSQLLLQLGHEHTISDKSIDFELTPNRGDCFSLLGILRDLNSLSSTDTEFEIFKERIDELNIDFKNEIPKACPYITFVEVEVDKCPSSYSDYLGRFYKNLNQKRINFFTDVSNYLSYEIGQPTHCYDMDKINDQIKLCEIQNKENFYTLTDKKIVLEDKNIVFMSKNEVINLAGIMGGKSTACSENTTRILLECAYFEPRFIIGKNLKYDLNSDAAHKFERGVDFGFQDFAIRRFLKIVQDHANIKNVRLKTFNHKEIINNKIQYNLEDIKKIIGIDTPDEDILNHLKNLGFIIEKDFIEVPSYRYDITNNNDLAEEVSRVIGYNNIKQQKINLPKKNTSPINKGNIVREYMTDNGFYEVINFPFVSDEKKDSIKIDNPIDSNKNFMRTDLQSSLENNLIYNERRQQESIKLFEISDVYSNKQDQVKQKRIGIIASGRMGRNYRDFSKKIDNNYFERIISFFQKDELIKGIKIINIPRDSIDSKSNSDIFYTEFNLDNFINSKVEYNQFDKKPFNFIKYKEISEYPSTYRDLSFALSNPEKYHDLQELLLNYKNKNLKDSFIFDFYYDEKNIKLKIGFRFIFESVERTLTDRDIDKIMDDIITSSLKIETVSIPGLK